MFFKRANLVDKQLLHLGLSNYKRMKRNLEFRKKNTCYNSKTNYSVSYSKESPLALMHLWHLSTIPSF